MLAVSCYVSGELSMRKGRYSTIWEVYNRMQTEGWEKPIGCDGRGAQ